MKLLEFWGKQINLLIIFYAFDVMFTIGVCRIVVIIPAFHDDTE